MASEKMYDLAYRYKSTKLWQQVFDDELFGVRLPDGEIGYCSIMGELGDHIALGLYVGDKGYRSYRFLLDHAYTEGNDLTAGIILTSQDCLQCSFENKDMLSAEELEEVRGYAKAHDKQLRGRNAFPQFTKYRPGRYPWHFDSALDEERICAALSAAIVLKKMLRGHQKYELGLNPLHEGYTKIPLLVCEKDSWIINFTALPDARIEYPTPEFTDEVMAARVRKFKKRGILQCGMMRLANPVQDEDAPDEAPYVPQVLVCVNAASGMVLPPIVTDGEDAAETAEKFAKMLLNVKIAPERLLAKDEQCAAALADFCKKTGISLSMGDDLEELDEAMSQMLYGMGEETSEEEAFEGLDELCQSLLHMRDGELKQMPGEMVEMLLTLADGGMIPDELAKRLGRIFR